MESDSVQPYNGPVVLDFTAIKDDIKETIAPPKKALVVIPEGTPTEDADKEPLETDPDAGGENINPADPSVRPLKAQPVEVLKSAEEMDSDEAPEDPLAGPSPDEIEELEKPRAIRAIPVKDDEVIQDAVEEP